MLTKTEKARMLSAFFPLSEAGRLVLGKKKEIKNEGYSATKYCEDGEISIFKDGYLVAVIM